MTDFDQPIVDLWWNMFQELNWIMDHYCVGLLIPLVGNVNLVFFIWFQVSESLLKNLSNSGLTKYFVLLKIFTYSWHSRQSEKLHHWQSNYIFLTSKIILFFFEHFFSLTNFCRLFT